MTQAISGNSQYSYDPTEFFKKMDTNSDGEVTNDELTTMLQSMSEEGSTISTEGIEELFNTIDTDGNGTISESENTAQMEKNKPSGPPPPKPPTTSELASTLEDLIASLTESSSSSSTSSTSSTSTLTELISSLKTSEDEETTTSILEQIRAELLTITQNSSDTYNQNGVASASLFQSLIDVKK